VTLRSGEEIEEIPLSLREVKTWLSDCAGVNHELEVDHRGRTPVFPSLTCDVCWTRVLRWLTHGGQLLRGATTFLKLGVQPLVYVIVQNKIRMVYPVSCTAVCSYVKSWGGPFQFWGVRTSQWLHPCSCCVSWHAVCRQV